MSRAGEPALNDRSSAPARQRFEPPAPVVRYERQRPGALVHIDTKKLGQIAGIGHRIAGRRSGTINRRRGSGWEYLHLAGDDASRLASTEILADERRASALACLERALAWFARQGVTVERLMTDHGNAYRRHDFRAACARAGVRHLRTRPYTPRTHGQAERFLHTVMRQCAYARAFRSSQERAAALPAGGTSPKRPPAAYRPRR